tara:strand:+ start:1226 stop:1693 length:468 start_codon:yes stop_codon:yes gene_type:complete
MNDVPVPARLETADIMRIMEMIPHRFPMLLIDRVVDIIPDKSATGIKNVTINEQYFQGHFPKRPVVPGVMIIESMAQTAAVLVVHTLGAKSEGKVVYFMSIDDARFRQPIVPADQMRVYVEKTKSRGAVWKFTSRVTVEGQLAAEASYAAMIQDN